MSRIAKAVITTIVLAVAFIPSLAQAQRAGDMTFGVMAGVQWAKVVQDPEPNEVDLKYKAGLLAGAFLGIQVTPVFSIEPQVLFSQKGVKVEGTGSNANLEGSARIDYIAVPLLGKFWFPMSNSQVTPFVFVGPEVAFKVSCKAEGVILAVTGEEDCDKTDIIHIKSTDFGGTVGGGVKFRAANQLVILDARYTHGFTNINDSGDNRDIKNRAFAVTVGLGFPLVR
jgi:hypothetical protein